LFNFANLLIIDFYIRSRTVFKLADLIFFAMLLLIAWQIIFYFYLTIVVVHCRKNILRTFFSFFLLLAQERKELGRFSSFAKIFNSTRLKIFQSRFGYSNLHIQKIRCFKRF